MKYLFMFVVLAFVLPLTLRAEGREYIIIIDVSASRNQQDVADAKQFLNTLVNQLSFSDELVALQMQQEGLSDHPRRWSIAMPNRLDNHPSARDTQTLESKKKGVRLVLPTFFPKEGMTAQHTDIFATLQIASEYMRDNGGKPTTIILLSDMLQSAQGIEMEKGVRMPARSFIPSQKSHGLLPPLPDACVVVVGADTASRTGNDIERFWQTYFTATGARLSPGDYRFIAPASMASVCR